MVSQLLTLAGKFLNTSALALIQLSSLLLSATVILLLTTE